MFPPHASSAPTQISPISHETPCDLAFNIPMLIKMILCVCNAGFRARNLQDSCTDLSGDTCTSYYALSNHLASLEREPQWRSEDVFTKTYHLLVCLSSYANRSVISVVLLFRLQRFKLCLECFWRWGSLGLTGELPVCRVTQLKLLPWSTLI